MTKLSIWVDPRRGKDEEYQPLLADETLKSWVARQSFVNLSSEDPEDRERAFGTITMDLPGAPRKLLNALRRAAIPPDAWMLQPHQRTLHCPRCIAEDWVRGMPKFERRGWCVAWRTCCPRHGQLFDADGHARVPIWPSFILEQPWNGREIILVHKRPFHVMIEINLHADRRAIHLEAALGESESKSKSKSSSKWLPRGLPQEVLRAFYVTVVNDLMWQFHFDFDITSEERPNAEFNRQKNPTRFALNVLAEAIISDWTGTPLPESASPRRTALLVRAIGWGAARPALVHAGQVLFRGPSERISDLESYKSLLTPHQYSGLALATAEHNRGWFLLPEARELGLDINDALKWLARNVENGRFLAFHRRTGRLVRNPLLPDEFLVRPDTTEALGVLLPDWACAPAHVDKSHSRLEN